MNLPIALQLGKESRMSSNWKEELDLAVAESIQYKSNYDLAQALRSISRAHLPSTTYRAYLQLAADRLEKGN